MSTNEAESSNRNENNNRVLIRIVSIHWLSIDYLLICVMRMAKKKRTITTFTLNDLCYLLFIFLFLILVWNLTRTLHVVVLTEQNEILMKTTENNEKTDPIVRSANTRIKRSNVSNGYTEQTNWQWLTGQRQQQNEEQ